MQDGRYCKSGDKTRLYLGTFYTTSTTTTEDSIGRSTTQVGGKRFLWNYYNRVPREMGVIDTTDSWTYSTNTTRQANAAAGNKVEFVIGIQEDVVDATLLSVVYAANAAGGAGAAGLGLDSTTVMSGLTGAVYGGGTENNTMAHFRRSVAVGYHYLAWLEKAQVGGSCIWIGDDNIANEKQSGLSAVVRA